MLTQSKVQTAGITDKKQKDILGIPSKKAATHTMNRPCGTKKEKPNNMRGSAEKNRDPDERFCGLKAGRIHEQLKGCYCPKARRIHPQPHRSERPKAKRIRPQPKKMLPFKGKNDPPSTKEMPKEMPLSEGKEDLL
jgi:hypothetical protein